MWPRFLALDRTPKTIGIRRFQPSSLSGNSGVSKLVGVAVREEVQHTGIETELVRVAEQVLRRSGSSVRRAHDIKRGANWRRR